MFFKNVEVGVRTIFGFSLCAVSLQAILVAYFRRALKKTRKTKPSESDEVVTVDTSRIQHGVGL